MLSVFAKQPPTPEEMRKGFVTKNQKKFDNMQTTSNTSNKQQTNIKSSDSQQQTNQQQRNRNQSNSQHDNRRRQNIPTSTSSTRNDGPDSSNQRRDNNNNPEPRYNSIGLNNPVRFVPGLSTRDLPPIETKTDPVFCKFIGRCRLFVGNLPHNVTEERVRNLFEKFGEIGEIFLGPKNSFAFVKLDYRKNAEQARDQLDGILFEGRNLRVRLSAHPAAIKVKNLNPQVTNELLAYAFRYFGEIERAVVITDEKGKSTCEGIVEFAKKPSALFALKKCNTENFILTTTPMPVLVEAFDQHDDEEGLPERSIAKHTSDFIKEREVGPRFADQGSFEESYASRWKELFAIEKQKRERLEAELREARLTLQNQIEYSRLEHDAAQLKNKLKQLEDDRIRLQQYNDVNTAQPVYNMYQTQTAGPSSSRPTQSQEIAFNNSNEDQSNTSTPVISEPIATSSNANLMVPSVNTQQRTYADAANLMNQQQYLQTMAAQSMMQPMYGAAYQPQLSMNVYQPQLQTYPNTMMTSNKPTMYQSKKNFNNNYDDSDGANSGRARKRGRY